MNVIRGLFSLGITIGCILNWIDINGVISVSGINWTPATVLLFISLLTSGYAFYNSYNSTNQNTWVYLITGLLGIGICIYGYIFVKEKMEYLDMFLNIKLTDIWPKVVGLGFYLTALCSVLLFFLSFDKSDSNIQPTHDFTTLSNSSTTNTKIGDINNSKIQEWLKENPGKSINDYFSKNR